jgi:hypothetical protein
MILAYSVARAGKSAATRDLKVLARGPLQCFYREREDAPQGTESEVRSFFTANQALFAQTDILEFRFPTLVHGTSDLEEFLARHEAIIFSELQRLHGLAQLSVYLPKSATAGSEGVQSGTEYLQKKSALAREQVGEIDAARTAVGKDLRDSVLQGNRLLMLVPRQLVPAIGKKVKAETGLVVAGPFPPSAFAKLLS